MSKKTTILVVDDDPINIKTFNDILMKSHEGFEILNSNNGQMALKIAQARTPDVILTDWEMPGMNGIELIKALKDSPTTQEIPIIMATGVNMTSTDLDLALSAGAVDYIRKPIDATELRARLRSALQMASHLNELKKKDEIIREQEKELLQNSIKQLETELEHRQRQISANISFLTQLENEKKNHIELVNELRPYLNAIGKSKLGYLLQAMDSTYHNKSLLEIENRFQEINRSFFDNLEKAYPDITKGEKMLCAYTLLKLPPAEIARITRKNQNSINVSFSRIRAKMNIATNKELIEVVNGLAKS